MNLELHPLFSSVVAKGKADFPVGSMFEQLKDENRYPMCAANSVRVNQWSGNVYSSINKQVLRDFPHEANKILEAFSCFCADVLKQESTKFVISTSWLTKSEKNSCGTYHCHQNSFYSGVLYENGGEGCAPFEIEKIMGGLPSIHLGAPSEWNVFNATCFSLDCEEGLMVFFPSGLMHRIGNHKAEATRYSLAFNFFPVGLIGEGDSSVSVQVY